MACYFRVYLNILFTIYPWHFPKNFTRTIEIDKTKVEFLTFMGREEKYDKVVNGDLNKVEKYDEEIVQNVQKGIVLMFYQHDRYSVTRQQDTHHFHRLLAGSLSH